MTLFSGLQDKKPPTVWLVNLYFGAGPVPTGTLLESVALGLQAQGCRVEVITGRSTYNAAFPAARRFKGVVHRLFSWPAHPRGLAGRLWSWLTFYAAVAGFLAVRRLPARVIVQTTPPFLHALFVARNLFRRPRADITLWNQDTYPDVLAAVGVLKKRTVLYRALAALQRWCTSRVRRVIILDAAMKKLVEGYGAREVRIVPNWESAVPSTNVTHDADELDQLIEQAREQYRYILLYTGNYGWGHDLSALYQYLRARPRQRDFFCLFVGGGEKWNELERLRRDDGLESVAVAGYVARERVGRLIDRADFGLVALERSCIGLMSPSKIHGYLARGKPLLYLGPAGSNVAEAIEAFGCGLRVDEDDPAGLAACLDQVLSEGFDYGVYAQNARTAGRRYGEPAGLQAFLEAWQGE